MTEMSSAPVEQTVVAPKRGGLLTVWLVLMLLANASSALTYLFANEALKTALPNIPDWSFIVYGALSIVNVVLVIMLFMWKRVGFYGFCGVSVLVFILNLVAGLGIVTVIFGLVGPIILYLIIKSKWAMFK